MAHHTSVSISEKEKYFCEMRLTRFRKIGPSGKSAWFAIAHLSMRASMMRRDRGAVDEMEFRMWGTGRKGRCHLTARNAAL
jgi:hypothetical protein